MTTKLLILVSLHNIYYYITVLNAFSKRILVFEIVHFVLYFIDRNNI